MVYQWIISLTTTSSGQPLPPDNVDLQGMVAGLFTQPSQTWLAGPQSVDDEAGPSSDWEWLVTFRTVSGSAPNNTALKTAVANLFGSTTDNVWLAGPQSVDDGDVTESSDGD